MVADADRSFTDETYSGDVEEPGSAEIYRPRFGRKRASDQAGSSAASALAWESLVPNVLKLTSLKQGWDGYNAPAIRWDAGLFALIVLQQTMRPDTPLPQVVPSSAGGIQLEWHERNIDLELHITGPYECEVWYEDHRDPDEPPISDEVTNDFSSIQECIDELTSRGARIANAV
jgi:hypothetical protein